MSELKSENIGLKAKGNLLEKKKQSLKKETENLK